MPSISRAFGFVPMFLLGLFTILFPDRIFDTNVWAYSTVILLLFVGFYAIFIRRGIRYFNEMDALENLTHQPNRSAGLVDEMNRLIASANDRTRSGKPPYSALAKTVQQVSDGQRIEFIPQCLYKVVQRAWWQTSSHSDESDFEAIEVDSYEFRKLCAIFRDVVLSIGIVGTFLGFMSALGGTSVDSFTDQVVPGLREAIGSSLIAVAAGIACTTSEWMMSIIQNRFRNRFQLFLWNSVLPELNIEAPVDASTKDFTAFLDKQNDKMDEMIGNWERICTHVSDAMVQVQQTLPSTIEKLTETSQQISTHLLSFTDASEGIAGTATSLQTALMQIGGSLQTLTNNIEEQTRDLASIAGTLVRTQPILKDFLAPRIQELTDVTQLLTQSANTLTITSDTVRQCMVDLREDMPNWASPIAALQNSADRLEASVGQLNSLVENIDAHSQQIDDEYVQALAQIATQIDITTDAIQKLMKTTERKDTQAMQAFDAASHSLQTSTQTIDHLARAVENRLSTTTRLLNQIRSLTDRFSQWFGGLFEDLLDRFRRRR
jgi:ABC-type transporter Mla subunit MlaD